MSCPVRNADVQATAGNGADSSESSCPYKGGSNDTNGSPPPRSGLVPANMMPPAEQLQQPAPGQRYRLSTTRVASSIPRSAADADAKPGGADGPPAHQAGAEGHGTWMYPSEQQYFNAMRRKGWGPQETDMHAVVAIHNSVNEQSWREVLKWEHENHPETAHGVKLKRFVGRPKDMSPKARLKTWMGYAPPFDRHDWIVERPDGEEVRYVIDFYTGAKPGAADTASSSNSSTGSATETRETAFARQPQRQVAIHIDARPALDSVGSAVDRLRMSCSSLLEDFRDLLPSPSPSPSQPPSTASSSRQSESRPSKNDND